MMDYNSLKVREPKPCSANAKLSLTVLSLQVTSVDKHSFKVTSPHQTIHVYLYKLFLLEGGSSVTLVFLIVAKEDTKERFRITLIV